MLHDIHSSNGELGYWNFCGQKNIKFLLMSLPHNNMNSTWANVLRCRNSVNIY